MAQDSDDGGRNSTCQVEAIREQQKSNRIAEREKPSAIGMQIEEPLAYPHVIVDSTSQLLKNIPDSHIIEMWNLNICIKM